MPSDPRDTRGQLVTTAQGLPAARDPYGPPVGYDEPASETAEHLAANLLEFWRIFKKRKWFILSVSAAFVTLNGVRTLMETPLYTATVRLQIDNNVVSKMVEGDRDIPVDT